MEEGEGDISHYAKLAKRKGEENLIFSLEDDNGMLQEGTQNIIKTVHNFYTSLYEKEEENLTYQDELLDKIENFITLEKRTIFRTTIKCFWFGVLSQNNAKIKNSGLGWSDSIITMALLASLGALFYEVVEAIYATEFLTESERNGIITISYKKMAGNS